MRSAALVSLPRPHGDRGPAADPASTSVPPTPPRRPGLPRRGVLAGPGEPAADRVILVVDDQAGAARALARSLRRGGFRVLHAAEGAQVPRLMQEVSVDLVVADLREPGAGGPLLSTWLSDNEPNVPFVFLVESPTVDEVVLALELGAVGVLVTPVEPGALTATLRRAWDERDLRLAAVAAVAERERAQRRMVRTTQQFEQALDVAHVVFQPVADVRSGLVSSYEALVRSPLLGDGSAHPFLTLAHRLGRTQQVDEAVRQAVASVLHLRPEWERVFVNSAPDLLRDGWLGTVEDPLQPHAGRVVFDLASQLPLDGGPAWIEGLRRLRQAGYGLAADDVGAALPFPATMMALKPDYVKLRMIDLSQALAQPGRRRYLRFLVDMAHEAGAQVVAVGVQHQGDRDLALELGCDLMQGFLIGAPIGPGRDAEDACRLRRSRRGRP
ncbi:EAL domain-containing protein [Myxococcota bacterium]|nr:EAL domain-containing protein [Myxococcota bacterium]